MFDSSNGHQNCKREIAVQFKKPLRKHTQCLSFGAKAQKQKPKKTVNICPASSLDVNRNWFLGFYLKNTFGELIVTMKSLGGTTCKAHLTNTARYKYSQIANPKKIFLKIAR